MKIGAKISLFNYEMRNRRTELGLTQMQLADMVGIKATTISEIERLVNPSCETQRLRDVLREIAISLDAPFERLFPSDYLEMLTEKRLPRNYSKMFWVREISLDRLPPTVEQLALPSPEEIVEYHDLQDRLNNYLDALPPNEQKIIKLKFGLLDGVEHTEREIAEKFHVTPTRINQIVQQSMSRLRHPVIRRRLREYLS